MAIVGQLMVLVGVNNAPLTAGLAASTAQLTAFSTGAMSKLAGISTALVGIGAVAGVGMGLAVGAARDFQEQMAKVNTIAHLTPTELTAIGDQVRALSVATGTTLPDLTGGLYDLLSVGVPVGQAMEFLGNATTLSIGGLSTANDAVTAITTAVNAWSGATGAANLTMADSAKVTDIFAQAIAAGGMTAADIPGALANVASSAAALNVPLEEIGAAWSILTVRGQTASEAATSMDAAFTALAKAPPGMEALEKATGKTYLQIAKTDGVHSALTQIVADAAKFGVELVDVFGRKEALPFVRFTTGTNEPLWDTALANEMNPAGVAAGQAAERMGTLDAKLRILGASVNSLGIVLGTALLPPLTTLVTKVGEIVQGVTNWAEENPGLASTILPVITGVGLLALGVLGVNAAFGFLALALGPVGLFLLVIIGIVALVITNMDNLKKGIQFVIDKWNELTSLAPFRQSDAVASFTDEFVKKHGRRPTPVELQQGGLGFNPTAPGDRTNPLIDSIRGQNNLLRSLPGVSGYAHGGMVPGSGPQLAIVHGGETITPAGRAGGGGTLILQVDGHEMYRITDERLAVRESLVTVRAPGRF